jgi:hypothetical protein
VGYLAGPTKPPRLPDENPSAIRSESRAPEQASTSGVSQDRSVRPRTSQRPADPVQARGRADRLWDRIRELPSRALREIRDGQVRPLVGKGPINLIGAPTQASDKARFDNFGSPFYYFRHDRDAHFEQPALAQELSYEDRRDVLSVGTGRDVTSYFPDAGMYPGTRWRPRGKTLSRKIDVIRLSNGRNGVGAIKLPFDSLAPGQSVMVTGGPLSGCSVLFAADDQNFYAYHAGTSAPDGKWLTSRDGVKSIAEATSR